MRRSPFVWLWAILCMVVGVLHGLAGSSDGVIAAWQIVGAYMAWTIAREDSP